MHIIVIIDINDIIANLSMPESKVQYRLFIFMDKIIIRNNCQEYCQHRKTDVTDIIDINISARTKITDISDIITIYDIICLYRHKCNNQYNQDMMKIIAIVKIIHFGRCHNEKLLNIIAITQIMIIMS